MLSGLVNEMLAKINPMDWNIQFTSERVKEGIISFLDVEIRCNSTDGSLSLKIYYKSFNTARPVSAILFPPPHASQMLCGFHYTEENNLPLVNCQPS